jgi:hypothetical protein
MQRALLMTEHVLDTTRRITYMLYQKQKMKGLCHAFEHKIPETRWHHTGFEILWNGKEWHGYRP